MHDNEVAFFLQKIEIGHKDAMFANLEPNKEIKVHIHV